MNYKDLENVNKELRKTDIKGKDYIEVNERVKAFRKLFPEGIIDTQLISNENGVCVFKAQVGFYTSEGVYWLATGHAQEKENSSFINKTSYIENCETSAVGRALGNAGFGIDTSIASAEEVSNAILNQSNKVNETMIQALRQAIKDNEIENEKVIAELDKLGYTKLNELEVSEIVDFRKRIGIE